jgi:hypothetical protein
MMEPVPNPAPMAQAICCEFPCRPTGDWQILGDDWMTAKSFSPLCGTNRTSELLFQKSIAATTA